MVGEFTTPTAEEWPLIFDSWARSFRNSPWAGVIRNCDYPTVSRAAMSEIVDSGARVTVLVSKTEAGERRVIGYSVSDPTRKVIHYIYVKRDWRGLGMGKRLRQEVVPDNELSKWVYTYRTPACSKFYRDNHGKRHEPVYARMKV